MSGILSDNVCQIILICIFIFILYQILCNYNKATGGEANKDKEPVESELDSELESDETETSYDYEPVLDENGLPNKSEIDTTNEVPVADPTPENTDNNVVNEYNVLGFNNDDTLQFINQENNKGNKKIKPNELLPANATDLEGNNFLTAALSKSEQIIGIPTQTQRSRKNYDLRSSPPNPQVEVSPWNMSTMEPDKERLQFEIGTSKCVSE